ncbi:hypothetical protein [Paraliomyxa miuraensis]|uniref:hypothetical protein n=1 Tax=Paraliomyxa miuraensis TaxID=376150 RepID=UPI002253117B|nr:hypothetical protein [Paraliomyxa miuraensis]MCX4243604.1 nucleoside 2-deoxyribosyltransferase [Paraliomyxa miuraensis]
MSDQPRNHWGVLLAVVAAADGVLGYLAATTQDTNLQAILAIGAIAMLLVCLWVVVKLGQPRRTSDDPSPMPGPVDPGPSLEIKYDLYISTPMDGLAQPAYDQHREQIRSLIEMLEAGRITRIACRIKEVAHGATQPTDVALERNLRSIRQSRVLVLVMPNRRSSSALVEVGAALAMGKVVFAFVASRLDNLPFLIRSSHHQPNGAAGPINLKTYTYGSMDDISRHILDNRHLIFGQPTLPPSAG